MKEKRKSRVRAGENSPALSENPWIASYRLELDYIFDYKERTSNKPLVENMEF